MQKAIIILVLGCAAAGLAIADGDKSTDWPLVIERGPKDLQSGGTSVNTSVKSSDGTDVGNLEIILNAGHVTIQFSNHLEKTCWCWVTSNVHLTYPDYGKRGTKEPGYYLGVQVVNGKTDEWSWPSGYDPNPQELVLDTYSVRCDTEKPQPDWTRDYGH